MQSNVAITITGGAIDIDSSDDSIHSNNNITFSGGTLVLASGDDGIHSDSSLDIFGGELNLMKCYEGLESAAITIHAGNIHIVASDDAINAVNTQRGSSTAGSPGRDNFNFSMDNSLDVYGGTIVCDAGGDGLDINGSVTMTGGILIIHGPTSNNYGALDYLGAFNISGGYLVAAGSAGMAQAPSGTSGEYSVIVNFPSMLSAGTMVHIETEDGEEMLTFVPTKDYQSVILCSPELKRGTTYVVYTEGHSNGASTDGLYADGVYSPGTQMTNFTISSTITGVGFYGGGFFGGPGGRG